MLAIRHSTRARPEVHTSDAAPTVGVTAVTPDPAIAPVRHADDEQSAYKATSPGLWWHDLLMLMSKAATCCRTVTVFFAECAKLGRDWWGAERKS